jgi:hypothetical protein
MLFSTVLTFFIVPATYVMLERLRGRPSEAEAGVPSESLAGAAASSSVQMREPGA